VTKDRELLQTVRYYGHRDAIDYLQGLLDLAQEERHGALLISLELGELSRADLQRLRPQIAEYVVGLVPFDPTLFDSPLLWNSPTMSPPRRLELLAMLGQLRIPTTVTLMVGMGESEPSRLQTLAALAELHARRGHLQGVRIVPFRPKVGTATENRPAAEPDVVVRTVRQACEIMGSVPVQVPALDVREFVDRCVEAGAQDLGMVDADPQKDMTARARHWGEVERRLVNHRLLERLAITESTLARGLVPPTLGPTLKCQLDRLEERTVNPVRVAIVPEAVPVNAPLEASEPAADLG
jgi:biotin synthase-like enzyme